MRKNIIFVLSIFSIIANVQAQKKQSATMLAATRSYMQHHLWNAQTQNFVRRADQPDAPGSDGWGITIVLDADAYMVEGGAMKPDEMKQYFQSSSMLYEKTNGNSGARILGRQGNQIYIGGDDDLQWCAALLHCFMATKDSDYLNAARTSFNALIDMDFWQNGASRGWSWNSNDRRPNGVSTAYGALAAARLYVATKDNVYKQWVGASLDALKTPQVGFFPRDMMVAANAAMTVFEVTKETSFRDRAMELEESAVKGSLALLHHDGTGERNPTDIGDLADGLFHFYSVTHQVKYKSLAETFLNFFAGHRTAADIAEHGFYSRYDTKGAPITQGAYLGVPVTVPFLPEVAEMLKLFAIAG
jgi:uncharacterized protein YyaL (SSP411 family)